MLLSQKQTIEDYVIESLAQDTRLTGPELLKNIQKRRGKTTKQAMYTVLETLLRDEIIAKLGNRYYISKLWIDKIDYLLQINTQKIENEAIFKLKEGESITYRFPTLLSCDTYWAHIFNLLIEWIPKERPICVWMPHQWFIVGRNKEEQEIFKLLRKHHKIALYSIGGKTVLDKHFKKHFSFENLKINIANNFSFKQNYYINIFDDFILEIYLSDIMVMKIENFYLKHDEMSLANMKEFERIIKEKHPVRMKISRKTKQAKKIRKQLSKDFYLPSHLEI